MRSNNLEVRVHINGLLSRSESLLKTIDKKTMTSMIKAFSEYLARVYLRLLQESIYSTRYKGKWEPTDDEGYLEYIGAKPKKHILTLMEDAIEVKKIGYYFVIRFNPRIKYPGSKKPLVQVLRAIDSGTSKFNARPIFRKILRELDTQMFSLWRGFLLQKGVL